MMFFVNLSATFLVPADSAMGDAQRIVYVHVSVAWLSLVGFLVMAGTGIQYLRHRDLTWDCWSQSAAELGWLTCTLTLVTGAHWAHEAWGTWWTWDPRLTTAFILWMLYSACLTIRVSVKDSHRRAKFSAVVAIVGLLDIPFVTMATTWFRGIHPVAPDMEPAMRIVLVATAIGYAVFLGLLLIQRQRQIQLEIAIDALVRDTLRVSEDAMHSASPELSDQYEYLEHEKEYCG